MFFLQDMWGWRKDDNDDKFCSHLLLTATHRGNDAQSQTVTEWSFFSQSTSAMFINAVENMREWRQKQK